MTALTREVSRRRSDELQFRVIYLATFPAFLLAASLARLLPRRRRGDPAGRSIFGEAQAAARTCGSLALLG